MVSMPCAWSGLRRDEVEHMDSCHDHISNVKELTEVKRQMETMQRIAVETILRKFMKFMKENEELKEQLKSQRRYVMMNDEDDKTAPIYEPVYSYLLFTTFCVHDDRD